MRLLKSKYSTKGNQLNYDPSASLHDQDPQKPKRPPRGGPVDFLNHEVKYQEQVQHKQQKAAAAQPRYPRSDWSV